MFQASQKTARVPPAAMARVFAQTAVVFAAYFVAGKLGQATSNVRSGNLGPVWPAYGVALAAILLLGYRAWIGVAAGAFVVALWSPVPTLAAAGQAAAATLAAVSGAFLLHRMNFQLTLSRLQDALALVVVGAFGSALVSSSIGVFVLYATHVQAYSGLGPAWLIYWLGDSTGVLLVTPLALTFSQLASIRNGKRRAEFAGLLLLLTAASFIVFSDLVLVRLTMHVLAFAVLPFVMWAAVRFGMSGATLATFVVATIATTATAYGFGPFARNTPYVNAVLLDVFFVVISGSGLVLAAVITERERARNERERLVREQAGTEARLRLGTIVESSDDAIIGMDVNGIVTDWNKGAEQLYGYSAAELIGKTVFLLVPPERTVDCTRIMNQVRQGVPILHHETVRLKKDGTPVAISVTGSPITAPDGQIVGLCAIDRDITERKRQETILRNSEERFRMAAHAGKMFAYEWDAATDVIVRSAEASEVLGIDASVPLTGQKALAGVHADDRPRLEAALAALTPGQPYLRVCYRILRADGSVIWVDRHSIAHFDQQGRLARIVGMVVDITERKQAEEALASAKSRLIEAQEQERTRIARELHDDIGQRLALLTVELDQLRRNTPGLSTEVVGRLDELRDQAREMSADLQSLSHELHSARLEHLGIAAATQGFCREFAERQGVEIDCKARDLPAQIQPAISLCLFRVLQEALHNSLKHSGVGKFEVRLWATADEVHLTVSDSGAGFDSEAARESRGLGLISMEERLKLLNGTFVIESQPRQGTTIHARVPLISGSGSMRAAG
jgi:PAS domain S-box-containing protein